MEPYVYVFEETTLDSIIQAANSGSMEVIWQKFHVFMNTVTLQARKIERFLSFGI
jgi:hypothetical protein